MDDPICQGQNSIISHYPFTTNSTTVWEHRKIIFLKTFLISPNADKNRKFISAHMHFNQFKVLFAHSIFKK